MSKKISDRIVELNGKERITKINFFVSYFQTLSTIQDDSEKWLALETVLKYAFYGIEPDLSDLPPQVLGFYFSVKPTIDKGIEDSLNGKSGGRGNKKPPSKKDKAPLSNKKTPFSKNEKPPFNFSESGKGIGIGEGIGEGEGEGKGIITTSSDEEVASENPTAVRGKSGSNPTPYQEIVDLYNSVCVSLPKVRSVSEARRKLIRSRYKQHGLDGIKLVFEKAEASDFLTGRKANSQWSCGFDWLMNESNFLKTAEGNYDNRDSKGGVANGTSSIRYTENEINEIFAADII